MKYFGEHLETLTTKQAVKVLEELKIDADLPSYRKAITLGTEGNGAYQLVKVGKGMYDIEFIARII
jgi:hypothetical protein